MLYKFTKRNLFIIASILAGFSSASDMATAGSPRFLDEVYNAVDSHDRVTAAREIAKASKQRIRVAKGGWFPEANLSFGQGQEYIRNPNSTETNLGFTSAKIEATQLLWDFGVTSARVEKSRLGLVRSELTLLQTRQDIMLEVVRAAIEYKRAVGVLGFAKQSEQNVRRQTGLEEAKVRAGDGLSTDVLQAKTQLAGARARLIRADGARKRALNTYKRYFHSAPTDVSSFRTLDAVLRELPASVFEAVDLAKRNNPSILIASVDELMARETVREVRADQFLPRLELIGNAQIDRNVDGTAGTKEKASVKLELSMPFNLGFTSTNALSASRSEQAAATYQLADARFQVEETVLNAWQYYETARSTAELLKDQANLAAGFLDLARKERELGNRSLIDVLAGESALFNAKSDALSMEADVLIAAFEVLRTTGLLMVPESGVSSFKLRKGSGHDLWSLTSKK